MRGAALPGLGGMAPRRGDLARPLLQLRRADVRAVAASRGLPTVDDPTNRDTRRRRSWVRHELLPMLGKGSERDLVPVLARQADVVRAESDLLDGLGDAVLRAARSGDTVAVAPLREAPPPITRRALRRWLGDPPPSASEIERVLEVVRGVRVGAELAGGRVVRRSGGRLRCERQQPLR